MLKGHVERGACEQLISMKRINAAVSLSALWLMMSINFDLSQCLRSNFE